jgi:hypothetical protein
MVVEMANRIFKFEGEEEGWKLYVSPGRDMNIG